MSNYFYIDENGSQHGPLTVDHFVAKRCLQPETMVWTNTLTEWQRADSIEELQVCLTPICSSTCTDTPPPIQNAHQNTFHKSQQYQNNQQYSNRQQRPPLKPETWLVWNILSVVLCCTLIPGVIGIIYSSKVDNYWAMGEYAEAERAASTAKIMFFISLGLCAVTLIGYVVSIIAGFSMMAPFCFV